MGISGTCHKRRLSSWNMATLGEARYVSLECGGKIVYVVLVHKRSRSSCA